MCMIVKRLHTKKNILNLELLGLTTIQHVLIVLLVSTRNI